MHVLYGHARIKSTATSRGARGSVTQKTAPPVGLTPALRQPEWPGESESSVRGEAGCPVTAGQVGKGRVALSEQAPPIRAGPA